MASAVRVANSVAERRAADSATAVVRAREAAEGRMRRLLRSRAEVEEHIRVMQGELEAAVAGGAGEAELKAELELLREVQRRTTGPRRQRDAALIASREGRAEADRLKAAIQAAEAGMQAMRVDHKILGEEVSALRVQIAITHSALRRCAAGMAALREEVVSVVGAGPDDA